MLAFGILGALVGAAMLVSLAPWWWLFGGGMGLMALGFLVGVPAGFWYHVLLYRALAPRGALGRVWWLHPTGLHGALTDGEKRRLMGPFKVGAVGFGLVLLGCVLFAVGALRS
jgi:hypothetical protein